MEIRNDAASHAPAVKRGATGVLPSMPPEVRARINVEVERTYRGVASSGNRAQATRRAALERTARLYADLWAMGFTGLKLENLKPGHVTALLELWRYGKRDAQGHWLRRPITRRAAADLWTVVRNWAEVIGKKGMVPAFSAMWPAEAQVADAHQEGPASKVESPTWTRKPIGPSSRPGCCRLPSTPTIGFFGRHGNSA